MSLPVPEHLQLRKQPKQQRTRQLLDKISTSTLTLVQEQGYFALNTNAIADHAGIYVNSLYEFFPNKEAILYRIADQWLHSLREMCEELMQEQYLDLPWTDYYSQMMSLVFAQEDYQQNYKALKGLWELIPEFSALDEFHRQYLLDFHCNNLKRFGAKGSEEELRILASYMMIIEDGLGAAAGYYSEQDQKLLWQHHVDTVMTKLEKVLP